MSMCDTLHLENWKPSTAKESKATEWRTGSLQIEEILCQIHICQGIVNQYSKNYIVSIKKTINAIKIKQTEDLQVLEVLSYFLS